MPHTITVEIIVPASPEETWTYWTEPRHIVGWAFASDDWEAPAAENDLRVGGTFATTMAAKDGSASFIMNGTYNEVTKPTLISYTMPDPDGVDSKDRDVTIVFAAVAEGTKVTETFTPETIHSAELQRAGWQAILENFKKYVAQSNS